ncbi:MAG: hypothetical protein HY072_01705 [Deltaproteobacteria bacterium]|nr:hypothetical protein [Deltaproteobacteria bacterium]
MAAKTVAIVWDEKLRFQSDLILGGSDDTELSNNRIFYGPIPSNIAYVHCSSWLSVTSICYKKENRVVLRNEFYRALTEQGTKPTLSFSPTIMVNIKEANNIDNTHTNYHILKNTSFIYAKTILKNALYKNLNHAFDLVAEKLHLGINVVDIPFKQRFKEVDPDLKKRSFDISVRSTDILVDDPMADIRFMFLSKEGIRLPDTDGRILKELKKENFDPQVINELLWDQAVIWPIGHFAFGLWAKKHIDFSMLNTVLSPTDFQWIGLKQ